MNRDEIIRMAREAGSATSRDFEPTRWQFDAESLERFAALVAAHEREECAQIAKDMPRTWDVDAQDPQHRIAAAIRARGNA